MILTKSITKEQLTNLWTSSSVFLEGGMPGSGGEAPNPESDNESVVTVTDSEEEHERKVVWKNHGLVDVTPSTHA